MYLHMYISKHRNSKLSSPHVRLDSKLLEYISQTKYLGFMFNTNAEDDEDMPRQMHTLYIRSNKLLRNIQYCSTDVNLELLLFFWQKTLYIAPAS